MLEVFAKNGTTRAWRRRWPRSNFSLTYDQFQALLGGERGLAAVLVLQAVLNRMLEAEMTETWVWRRMRDGLQNSSYRLTIRNVCLLQSPAIVKEHEIGGPFAKLLPPVTRDVYREGCCSCLSTATDSSYFDGVDEIVCKSPST